VSSGEGEQLEFGETYPWTRGEGESSPAYAAFREYMLLGAENRSLDETVRVVGKSRSLLSRWSQKFDWVGRASAYDTYMTTARVDGEADAYSRVRNRHLDVAEKLLDHLAESMLLWKPGHDPSIRWTSAFTAAAKVQQTALTLKENLSRTDEEAVNRILDIMARKAESE
jgi:hypothetical protein